MTPLTLRIRELRTRRGWSQAELGRRAGVHASTVNRIERNAASRGRTNPRSSLRGDERTRTADPLLAKQVLYQLSYVPKGMQETRQKSRPGSSIRRTSSLPSARTRRNQVPAPLGRCQGVFEEEVDRCGEGYAEVLTPSRARCLASVSEFTISAKPSRSAV